MRENMLFNVFYYVHFYYQIFLVILRKKELFFLYGFPKKNFKKFKKIGGLKIVDQKIKKSLKTLDFVQKLPNMRKNMRKNVKYANMRIKVFYAQKVYLLDFDIPNHHLISIR